MTRCFRSSSLWVTLMLLGVSPAALAGGAGKPCVEPACNHVQGKAYHNSTTERVETGNNTEAPAAKAGAGELFSISVDGEHVAGTAVPEDSQRKTDLNLEAVDIQVKFDGLDPSPILNVSTVPPRRGYTAGEHIDFLASNNYPAWITRSEVRIFDMRKGKSDLPYAVVPVTPQGAAGWAMPKDNGAEYTYVLRVYDGEGRFDETKPLTLQRTGTALPQHETDGEAVAPGYGEDRTATRGIPIYGGVVTVYGRNVPGGDFVTVLGDPVPVDPDGSFVVQRILPPGDHAVDVGIEGKGNNGLTFNRAINIPSNEWFYVGLADLTVGKRFGSGDIEAVKPGEFDNVYTKGRLAFYLKGKIKGRYLLTAAGDTGEEGLKTMFKGLDKKDPKQFLRRIDPDDYYPVYGDDSTTVDDAPTRGKFYVRLARGDSHVMWGNFKTEIRGTEFLRNERALYGASGVYKADEATSFGERKTEVSLYAAQPGTLPQRDVLRGTGGSAYFLKHQDVTVGSETITIEIRNRVTGQIIERRSLAYGTDYDIDYMQGVVLLKKALSSSTPGNGPVRGEAFGDNDVYLIANYEFTPAAGEVKGYAYGGRAQQWLGEHVRVGVTGASEKTGGADQKLAGADIQLRKSERTYVEAEYARSKGPGFGKSISTDGGLTLSDEASAGVSGKAADAYRVRGRMDLGEVTNDAIKGDLQGYFETKGAGFSSLTYNADARETEWGAAAEVELTDMTKLAATYDEQHRSGGKQDRELAANIEHKFSDQWKISTGVKDTMREQSLRRDGNRWDIGAIITRNFTEDDSVYVFGQGTVHRSGEIGRNDRGGVGATKQLTEKLSANVEGSYGSSGIGGAATLDYKPTADDHYYIGYKLDPDRENSNDFDYALQGDDLGAIVAGVRRRYSERLSVYAEDNVDLFGMKHTLTQTYGVKYTPNAVWTLDGGVEMGTIWDDTVNTATGLKNIDFDRKAISLSAGYHPSEKADGHIKGEVRFEDSEDGTRDRNTYMLSAGLGYNMFDDWRMIADLDAVISDASSTLLDGQYVEGSIGYAYRPTLNDRLNALFKYTFLYDNPGKDQVTVSGALNGPSQLSHIISADVTYDINEILSVGGKYGFRFGEIKDSAPGSDWEYSTAHLGVIRADLHVVKNWDALLEGRALWSPTTDSVDYGVLAAVYRHVSDNFKIGVGYNFGHFSDDLRDLVADDHGVFINAVGQF